MKISNIKYQESKIQIKSARIFTFLVCVFGFSFLIFGFSSGCAYVKKYSQSRHRLSAINTGELKGLDKVDIAKKFGGPTATSKSDVSECWYYAEPREIWIWFEENKVTRWEVK